MAMIMLEYDTDTKQCMCKVGDESVTADYIGFYRNEDQYHMEIGLKTEDMGGMKKYSRIVAQETKNTAKFGSLFMLPKMTEWFEKILKK